MKAIALSGGALVALAYASSAYAQDANAPGSVEEVVVTGSRVITNGFAAPTPLTVITAEQMKATAPTSLSDAINQRAAIPAILHAGHHGLRRHRGLRQRRLLRQPAGAEPEAGAGAAGRPAGGPMQANGQIAGAVDLNILPQSLVKRIDVVTGGVQPPTVRTP